MSNKPPLPSGVVKGHNPGKHYTAPGPFFTRSQGGLSTVNQGDDPLLGPPFPPGPNGAGYDLLIHATGSRFTWNTPIVGGPGAIKFNNASSGDVYVRFKVAATGSSPTPPVTPTLVVAGGSSDLLSPPVYPQVLFIWVTKGDHPNVPTFATTEVPTTIVGGVHYNPQYIICSVTPPEYNDAAPGTCAYSLLAIPTNSISGYSLYRRTDASFAGTMSGGAVNWGTYSANGDTLYSSPVASDLQADDTTVPNPRLYYRLIGHTNSFDFLYNDVYIVAAPALTIDGSGAHWTADTTADHFVLNKSTDGGNTWTQVNNNIAGTGASSYTYSNTGLVIPGVKYQVIEFLPDGTQVPSNVVSVTTTAAGTLTWFVQAGGISVSDNAAINGVAVNGLGNVTVGGGFNGTFKPGNGSTYVTPGAQLTNGFLTQYDPTGVVRWAHPIGGGNNAAQILGVASDSGNNTWITGFITPTNLTGGVVFVGNWYLIASYQAGDDFTNIGASSNTNGVIFQATGTTPTNWAHSSTICSLVDFGVGNTFPLVVDSAQRGRVAFLVKYDTNGNFLTGKSWWTGNSTAHVSGLAVTVDSANNVIMGGYFFGGGGSLSFDGGVTHLTGNNPFFLVKFDSNLNHIWSEVIGGNAIAGETSTPFALNVDPSNNILACGEWNGTGNFGGSDVISTGGGSGWLAKYSGIDGSSLLSQFVSLTSGNGGGASLAFCKGVASLGSDILITGQFVFDANGTGPNFGDGVLVNPNAKNISAFFSARYSFTGSLLWKDIILPYSFIVQNADDSGGAILSNGSQVVVAGHIQSGFQANGNTYFGNGVVNYLLLEIPLTGRIGNYPLLQRAPNGKSIFQAMVFNPITGNVITAGWFQSTTDFGNGNKATNGAAQAVFVASYSS